MQSSAGAEDARRLALLGIGEIGRCADLSAFPQLQQALTSALTSPSEKIKAAASLALGAVSIGNMDTYLPFVIQQINEQVGIDTMLAASQLGAALPHVMSKAAIVTLAVCCRPQTQRISTCC